MSLFLPVLKLKVNKYILNEMLDDSNAYLQRCDRTAKGQQSLFDNSVYVIDNT